jgi:hypothetical protein
MGAFDSFASGLGEPKATVTIEPVSKEKNILEGVNPDLSERISQAQLAYKEKYGKDLPITSGARSYAKQKELFERWKKGDKGIYMPTNPDIDKKEIYHTNAVDISADVPEDFLNQFGLHRPLGKKDPVHTVLMPNVKSDFKNVSLQKEPSDDEGFFQALQKGSLSEAPKEENKPVLENKQSTDTNKINAFAAGFGGAISRGAGAIEQLVGKGVSLVAPDTGKAIEQHALEQIKKTEETTKPYIEANPITGAVGEVTGMMANPVNKLIPGFGGPAKTMLGGVAKGAAQGAIANALTTPVTDENKSFLTEKLKDALVGGAAGGVVGGVAKTATSLAQPFQNQLSKISQDNVKILRDAGVPIDVAQATGSQFLNRTKAALSDNPFTVGKEVEFAAQQQTAYNKAIAKTMGEDATAITPDVIQNAKNRLGDVYDDLYNKYGAKISGNVYKDLASVRDEALKTLPASEQTIIKNIVDDIINKASENRSVLTGQQFQAQKKLLDRLISQNSNISHYAQDLKEVLLSGLKNSIKNSDDIALLKKTNTQYGNMKKIEDVVLKNEQGNISPSLLSNSLATKGKRNALYAEDRELANLARAGKDILQSKVPNSGTIARLSAQAAPALVGGAVYGAYQGDLKSAAEGAALGYAAPKLAQMLLRNPKTAKYLEQGVSNKTLRSFLELPKKTGEVLPVQPGVVGASSLKELINLRNQGQ